MLDTLPLTCPYCGETFETTVDPSYGEADYVEDCPVCCRPLHLHLSLDDAGRVRRLDATRED